jgi:hypothetical protein
MKAVDGGGPVLTRARIVLIFRGSGWVSGVPSVDDAKKVLAAVLTSPYPSYLKQYRDIRRPQIVDTVVDTGDFGNLGPDPRGFIKDANVWRVSDSDIQNAVKAAFATNPPHDGEDTYYMVLFSHDPLAVYSDKPNLNAEGYHSQFDDNRRTITYGTLLNWSANTAANVWNSSGSLPAVFAHEVVEACTDPGKGFRLDNGEELADLSDSRSVQLPGIAQDISLAAYWSELSGVAVVPTSYSLRIAFGLQRSQSMFLGGALSVPRGSTIRNAILKMFNP